MKRLTLSTLVVLLLGLASEDAIARSFVVAGSDLPSFSSTTLSGGPFSTTELEGKVGIIIFVRPTQEASRSLLRELVKLKEELGGKTWSAVAVISGKVPEETIRTFVRESGFSGKVLVDPERKVYARFGVIAVPSLAVFDARRRVVYSIAGPSSKTLTLVRTHARKLVGIAEPKTSSADDPERSTPTVEFARGLLERGDFAAAEKVLRPVFAGSPPPLAYLTLAEIQLLGGKAAKALETIATMEKEFAKVPDPRILRARALAATGAVREAEQLLVEVTIRRPDSWEAHFRLGELHEGAGQKVLALEDYKKAIAILRKKPDRGGR